MKTMQRIAFLTIGLALAACGAKLTKVPGATGIDGAAIGAQILQTPPPDRASYQYKGVGN